MDLSIGIDVSKKQLDVIFFNGESFKQYCFSNDEKGLEQLISEIELCNKNSLIITMEATGNYHLLAAYKLHDNGYKVSVVNPLIIKRYGEMKMMRAKTDIVDAKLIAEYGMYQKSYEFIPKSSENKAILYYLKGIEDLMLIKTQNKNRLEALSADPKTPDLLVKTLLDINSEIDNKIKEIEKALKNIIDASNKYLYSKLNKIPGVGKRTSSAFIGFFNEFENFENAKQVCSYIGINPSPKFSGTSVHGQGTISRKGNSYLRKLLYMAALSASKHNAACAQMYERMVMKGKSKRVALIAVANKLIRQIFAIVKYNREYVPLYHEKILT
jgi:transposase